jgi:hypothetical protein
MEVEIMLPIPISHNLLAAHITFGTKVILSE